MSDIDDLKAIIHKLHGATVTHRESVPVREVLHGQMVWDGIVEVFDLNGHPHSDIVYAWLQEADDPGKPKRHVIVLHVPPVESPLTAVRAAILQEL